MSLVLLSNIYINVVVVPLQTLGRFGRVVQVNNNDGVVLVRVKGRVWAYSPLCLAPNSELPVDILTGRNMMYKPNLKLQMQ